MKKLVLILGLAVHSLYAQTSIPSKAWSDGIDLDDDKVKDITFASHGTSFTCGTFFSSTNLPVQFSLKFNQKVITTNYSFETSVVKAKTCGPIDDVCIIKTDLPVDDNYIVSSNIDYFHDKDSVVSFISPNVNNEIHFYGQYCAVKIVDAGETIGYFESGSNQFNKIIYPYYKAFYTDQSNEEGFDLQNSNALLADSIWYCEKFKEETDRKVYLAFCKTIPGPNISYQSGWLKLSFKDENFSTGCNDSTIFEIEEAYIGETDTPVIIGLTTTSASANVFEHVALSPNPANDRITISNMSGGEATVLSTKGEFLYQQKITSDREILDIKNIEAGFYFMKLSKDEQVDIRKILIE